MPGLRSLVARRRCSLPSTHIATSEQILYSYPSVAGTNKPRKRNSVDTQTRDNIISKDCAEENGSKWDLKTVFEIKDENLTSSKQNGEREIVSFEEAVCRNNDSNALGKENDEIFTDCIPNYCKNVIHSEKLEETCTDSMSKDNLNTNHNVSPERIVIKMKLLHGNSLSDVTNIASDSPESSDGAIRDKLSFESENNSSMSHTRWTIDSIMNGPVNNCSTTSENLEYFPENSPECGLAGTVPMHELEINSPNSHPNYVECDQVFEKPKNEYDFSSSNSFENEIFQDCSLSNSMISGNHLMTEESDPLSLEKLDSSPAGSELNSSSLKIPVSLENNRRSSDSSETSEESVCSEVSSVSNCSSTSSVKSCSIVIKRLENSDTYSCFRSPKNKKKRYQEISINYQNRKCVKTENSLLYISKDFFIKNTKMENLPCSVILCDIFSNYPFTKMNCPHCLRIYNMENDLFVNIDLCTITLQCTYCNWLVVRKLLSKHINLQR